MRRYVETRQFSGQSSAVRMRTARDQWSVALTTIVGSRVRVNPGAAAENSPDTARKGRGTVTLRLSALVRLCVALITASMRINLLTAAVNIALR